MKAYAAVIVLSLFGTVLAVATYGTVKSQDKARLWIKPNRNYSPQAWIDPPLRQPIAQTATDFTEEKTNNGDAKVTGAIPSLKIRNKLVNVTSSRERRIPFSPHYHVGDKSQRRTRIQTAQRWLQQRTLTNSAPVATASEPVRHEVEPIQFKLAGRS
ncbi:hypothetical protein [Methylobacterium crusticola]|uniref:hypothetical protein n=1 Tax=Methylobacterium crusticola TaxID=1697972 RepID=UPI000FFBFE2F|nr:hypothetical protein [Methylobacterium crusticola]